MDQFEMLIDGDGLTQPLDLQQFALNHGLREIDQGIEDLEIALLQRRS